MSYPTFHSYKPYLQLSLMAQGLSVAFDADCSYTPQNEREIQILREYAKATEGSYIISESMPLEDLKRGHEAYEERMIADAEAKAAAQEAAEKKQKEDHEFYSILRMADKAYR